VLIKGTKSGTQKILTENFLSKQALTIKFVQLHRHENEELTAKSITLKVVMQSFWHEKRTKDDNLLMEAIPG
jgi:hypothetical protein